MVYVAGSGMGTRSQETHRNVAEDGEFGEASGVEMERTSVRSPGLGRVCKPAG